MLLPEHLGKYIKVVVTPRNERFAYGTPVSFVTPQIIGQQVGNPRTDWFMNAKYGISCHFLPNYQNLSPAIPDDEKRQPGETWDDFLSTFDVDAYAQAVADLGAGFVLLTIDQHSGYNLAPSAIYDSILDIAPGVRSPSQRDLPMEIAQALAKYDIKLMFYFMGFLPAKASLTYYDDDANPHSPDRWGVPGNSEDGHHYDVDGLTAWVKNATDLQGVISMDIRVNRFGELDSFVSGQIKAVKSVVYPDGVVKKRG
ncbi:alpha-L-fucosidase [Edaphovirga cremea]|uniref:alpha-L-fucosidase n=1 Tax=Edaphovirga cremea TaxID=2267246 RepID=UPI003989BE40